MAALVHLLSLMVASADNPVRPEIVSLSQCGPIALANCLNEIQLPASFSAIHEKHPPENEDFNLLELFQAAERLKAIPVGLCWSRGLPDIDRGQFPAVLPVIHPDGRGHFVALLSTKEGDCEIWDFPSPPRWMTEATLRSDYRWNGQALHLCRTQDDASRLTRLATSSRRPLWLVASIGFVALAGWSVLFRRRNSMIGRSKVGSRDSRSGFTIIELLVVLGIVGLLLALALPAVSSAREQARQVACRNALHQIMLATHAFESSHGHLPSRHQAPPTDQSSTGLPLLKVTFSPQSRLLPFLDQASLWQKIDLQETQGPGLFADPPTSEVNADVLRTTIPVFQCPSDNVRRGGNSYRACTGTGPDLPTTQRTDPFLASLAGWAGKREPHSRDVSDGLSQTAFFAERLVGDGVGRYTPSRDLVLRGQGAFLDPEDARNGCRSIPGTDPPHASSIGSNWLYSGYGHTSYNHVLPPNAEIPDCTVSGSFGPALPGAHTARSLHPGGVHVAYGDGAVKFVSQDIDLRVWRAIGSISGGESFEAP